ncbi:MAG: UTP--glucose-1-phosphate uridylyltransferase GalU [bacterium]
MKKIRKAVIPAAGFGTRFLPATKSMPKEMLPIIDKPAIHYAVEEAVRAGAEEIIFITGRGKRAIEDYFDHSYELEHMLELKGKDELLKEVKAISEMAEIVYVRQKEPLGLGHAVLRAKELVGDEPFIVILPDVLMEDGGEFTKKMVAECVKTEKSVIGVQEVPWEKVSSYGVVAKEGDGDIFDINGVVEKPKKEDAPSNLSIYGRYILTPSIFKYLEKTTAGAGNEIQLTDALEKQIEAEGAKGMVYKGKYFDTGDKLGFLEATVCMALKHDKLNKEFKKFLNEVR